MDGGEFGWGSHLARSGSTNRVLAAGDMSVGAVEYVDACSPTSVGAVEYFWRICARFGGFISNSSFASEAFDISLGSTGDVANVANVISFAAAVGLVGLLMKSFGGTNVPRFERRSDIEDDARLNLARLLAPELLRCSSACTLRAVDPPLRDSPRLAGSPSVPSLMARMLNEYLSDSDPDDFGESSVNAGVSMSSNGVAGMLLLFECRGILGPCTSVSSVIKGNEMLFCDSRPTLKGSKEWED